MQERSWWYISCFLSSSSRGLRSNLHATDKFCPPNSGPSAAAHCDKDSVSNFWSSLSSQTWRGHTSIPHSLTCGHADATLSLWLRHRQWWCKHCQSKSCTFHRSPMIFALCLRGGRTQCLKTETKTHVCKCESINLDPNVMAMKHIWNTWVLNHINLRQDTQNLWTGDNELQWWIIAVMN